jgi:NADPH:quinone reductase-like Zn-dependent oxidoreductase
MGGMGRQFDGGYAEYTCVPSKQAQVIKTELPWETLGAIPEMLQTAWVRYSNPFVFRLAWFFDPTWLRLSSENPSASAHATH